MYQRRLLKRKPTEGVHLSTAPALGQKHYATALDLISRSSSMKESIIITEAVPPLVKPFVIRICLLSARLSREIFTLRVNRPKDR